MMLSHVPTLADSQSILLNLIVTATKHNNQYNGNVRYWLDWSRFNELIGLLPIVVSALLVLLPGCVCVWEHATRWNMYKWSQWSNHSRSTRRSSQYVCVCVCLVCGRIFQSEETLTEMIGQNTTWYKPKRLTIEYWEAISHIWSTLFDSTTRRSVIGSGRDRPMTMDDAHTNTRSASGIRFHWLLASLSILMVEWWKGGG